MEILTDAIFKLTFRMDLWQIRSVKVSFQLTLDAIAAESAR